MKKFKYIIFVAVAAVAAIFGSLMLNISVNAQDGHQQGAAEVSKDLHVMNAYAFETAATAVNGAAFFRLHNASDKEQVVVSASVSSVIADRAELHTHLNEDGVMKMRQVDRFVVPAKEQLELSPMGDHVMVMGLKSPLKAGAFFKITLTLEDGTIVVFPVAIRSLSEKSEGSEDVQDHQHHMMDESSKTDAMEHVDHSDHGGSH